MSIEFARFLAVTTGIPIAAVLALNHIIGSKGTVAIISAVVGYSVGKRDTKGH